MVCFMSAIGRLYFATKLDATNECDALESNKIIAGCELARNIPEVDLDVHVVLLCLWL
jgi:hypothetical protein